MTFIGTVELLALAAALCALAFWLVARGEWLRRDSFVVLGGLIVLTVFLNLSDALRYNHVTGILAPIGDNLEVLRPLLWGLFLYSFVQTLIQREILERERESELLLANLPHMVSFKDGRFVYLSVNEKFARELGLSPPEVVGKTDFDLFPPAVAEEQRTEDRRVIESGEAHRQVMTTGPEGGERVIEVTRIPVTGESESTLGLLTIQTDITDRLEAEEALRKTELEKEAILDSMSEIVVFQGPEMDVLWANRAAAESVGMTVDEIVGRKCHQVWQRSGTPCPDCPIADAREDGRPHEGQMTTFDGRVWLVRGYPVPGDGGERETAAR
jgi:PAS domain S-box-containing protein